MRIKIPAYNFFPTTYKNEKKLHDLQQSNKACINVSLREAEKEMKEARTQEEREKERKKIISKVSDSIYQRIVEKIISAYKIYSSNGTFRKTHNYVFEALLDDAKRLESIASCLEPEKIIVLLQEILNSIKSLNENRKGYLIDYDSNALKILIEMMSDEFKITVNLTTIGICGHLFGCTQYDNAIKAMEKALEYHLKSSEPPYLFKTREILDSNAFEEVSDIPENDISEEITRDGMIIMRVP